MKYDLILQKDHAVLSDNLISLLFASPSDRIKIEYTQRKGHLVPVIRISKSGNVLSKNNTFVCKGKDRDFLEQFGTNFTATDDFGTILLIGDKDFQIYTDVKQAADENYLDMSVVTDTNYHITKFTEYKI